MRQWAYFDTSVIVKLYVKETGSTEARQLIKKHRPLSSVILNLEVLSAFSRRKAEGSPTEDARSKATAYFRPFRVLSG